MRYQKIATTQNNLYNQRVPNGILNHYSQSLGQPHWKIKHKNMQFDRKGRFHSIGYTLLLGMTLFDGNTALPGRNWAEHLEESLLVSLETLWSLKMAIREG